MIQATAAASPAGNPIVMGFAHFWSDPNLSLLDAALADDVVGRFPGDREPVKGLDAYKARIGRFLDAIPDLRLTVAEWAENGNDTFIRWIARGTGPKGPIEFSGIDRIRVRDGLVVDNVVVYDTALFDERVYGKTP